MSLTYAYKDKIPIVKVIIEAENDSGNMVRTQTIDIRVDTGASHIALPESLLKATFGLFPTQHVPGRNAGIDTVVKLALLSQGKIHFLDQTNTIVHSEELNPLKVAVRNTYLLGRSVIDKQIYKFDGKNSVLEVSLHTN